jgi:UDP-N-acetyl-2-amino-2-deoxyglucuronate dehydrogenase
MTNTSRVGIVGFGAQGSVYAELISGDMVPNMDLGAICDRNPATRQLVESKYPGAVFYDDYLTMLDSGSVDAVVICVPSYLHPQMGIDALQHGIHVLLEKPAGVYTKQVKELNAVAATKPELTFAIMFNQRNNPLYRKIKEIISSGGIGAIRHTSWIITTWWRPQAYYDQSPGGLRGAAKAAECL